MSAKKLLKAFKDIDPEWRDMPPEGSSRILRPALLYVEKSRDRAALAGFARQTGVPLAYLEDENTWLSNKYFQHFYTELVRFLDDPMAAYSAGLMAWHRGSWGALWYVFAAVGNPGAAYRQIVAGTPDYTSSGAIELVEMGRNRAVIRWTNTDENRLMCDQRRGQFAAVPLVWHLPPAKINETSCLSRGGDCCLYEIHWQNRPSAFYSLLFALSGVGLYLLGILFHQYGFNLTTVIILLLGLGLAGGGLDTHRLRRGNAKLNQEIDERLLRNIRLLRQQNKQLDSSARKLERANERLERHKASLRQAVVRRTSELVERQGELERALRNLQQNQLQMTHMAKMASLGTLVAGIAHEINNPLNYVINGIEPLRSLLLETLPADPENPLIGHIQTLMASIEEGALRTARIVKDLRAFSQQDRGELALCDLNQGLEQALRFLPRGISESTAIVREFGDLGAFLCNGSQINQVFFNLIDNAAQAIPECADCRSGQIRIATRRTADGIVIEVEDNGIGILPEHLDQIFDPFFTTKPPQQGTGLGLSISHMIVDRHGGHITVTSTPLVGTRFTVFLPEVGGQLVLPRPAAKELSDGTA